jgi:hypothetical protein
VERAVLEPGKSFLKGDKRSGIGQGVRHEGRALHFVRTKYRYLSAAGPWQKLRDLSRCKGGWELGKGKSDHEADEIEMPEKKKGWTVISGHAC